MTGMLWAQAVEAKSELFAFRSKIITHYLWKIGVSSILEGAAAIVSNMARIKPTADSEKATCDLISN